MTAAGNALRIDRGDLFELMADNMPLLQGIFSGLLHSSAGRAADRRTGAGASAPTS